MISREKGGVSDVGGSGDEYDSATCYLIRSFAFMHVSVYIVVPWGCSSAAQHIAIYVYSILNDMHI